MIFQKNVGDDEASEILQHYVHEYEYRFCEGTCDCNQSEECPWTSLILKGE